MFRSLDKGQSAPPCLPPALPPMGVALLLRPLSKRPHGTGAAPSAPLRSEFLADAFDGAGIERYNAVLGFAPGAMPVTCYYLAVQRANMVTMLAQKLHD